MSTTCATWTTWPRAGRIDLIDTVVACVATETWAENGGGEAEIRPLQAGPLGDLADPGRSQGDSRPLGNDPRNGSPGRRCERRSCSSSEPAAANGDEVVTRSYILQINQPTEANSLSGQVRELITTSLPDEQWAGRLDDGQPVVLTVLPDRIVLRHRESVQNKVRTLLSDSGIADPRPQFTGEHVAAVGGGGGGFGGAAAARKAEAAASSIRKRRRTNSHCSAASADVGWVEFRETHQMHIGPTEILDTYAEAFGARYTRLIITAADDYWLDAALRSITGYGTSVLGCDAEAGVERMLSADESPDGRPAAAVLLFAFTAETVGQAAQHRVGQCVLTCPTTACFNGLPDAAETYSLGKYLRYFGDGFEEQGAGARSKEQEPTNLDSSLLAPRSPLWRIPVMDGEFLIEATAGIAKGVAGGNIILQGALDNCRPSRGPTGRRRHRPARRRHHALPRRRLPQRQQSRLEVQGARRLNRRSLLPDAPRPRRIGTRRRRQLRVRNRHRRHRPSRPWRRPCAPPSKRPPAKACWPSTPATTAASSANTRFACTSCSRRVGTVRRHSQLRCDNLVGLEPRLTGSSRLSAPPLPC